MAPIQDGMFLKLLTRKTVNVHTMQEKKSRVGAFEARQQRRSDRRHEEEHNIEREGDTYVPGGF